MQYLVKHKNSNRKDFLIHLYELDKETNNFFYLRKLNDNEEFVSFYKNEVELIEANEFKNNIIHTSNENVSYIKKVMFQKQDNNGNYMNYMYQVINENEHFIQVEQKSTLGYFYPILEKDKYNIIDIEIYSKEEEIDNYLNNYQLDL